MTTEEEIIHMELDERRKEQAGYYEEKDEK